MDMYNFKTIRKDDDTSAKSELIRSPYAIACPSEVEVPRPSSSNATSELRVADVWVKPR